MPLRLPKDRVLFFASIMFLQVALHVSIGLSMYALYTMARCIHDRIPGLLPNQLAFHLWQMGLVFCIFG